MRVQLLEVLRVVFLQDVFSSTLLVDVEMWVIVCARTSGR